jgi:hypothetical protein
VKISFEERQLQEFADSKEPSVFEKVSTFIADAFSVKEESGGLLTADGSRLPVKTEKSWFQKKQTETIKSVVADNKDEIVEEMFQAVKDRCIAEWSEVETSVKNFVTENPACVVGAASFGASAIATGLTAAFGDIEDVPMVAAISTTLSSCLTVSTLLLNKQGIDMSKYSSVSKLSGAIVGTASMTLIVRELVSFDSRLC